MNKITEVAKGLYLGNASNLINNTDEFESLGINVVISCCREVIHEPNDKWIVENYPIDDDGLDGSFQKFFMVAVDSIHQHLSNGKTVYVHCMEGVNRSVAIIIYYLMKYNKISFDQAYFMLKMKRPCIDPINVFVREIKKYDEYKSDNDFLRNKYSDL